MQSSYACYSCWAWRIQGGGTPRSSHAHEQCIHVLSCFQLMPTCSRTMATNSDLPPRKQQRISDFFHCSVWESIELAVTWHLSVATSYQLISCESKGKHLPLTFEPYICRCMCKQNSISSIIIMLKCDDRASWPLKKKDVNNLSALCVESQPHPPPPPSKSWSHPCWECLAACNVSLKPPQPTVSPRAARRTLPLLSCLCCFNSTLVI